jgi:hypothetical protein
MSSKARVFIKSIGNSIATAMEKAAEREQEYVSQDHFHAQNYAEADALAHLRGMYHSEFRCPICRFERS